ncbi:hypothetical protein [Streptobacillus notomytis]|uniref:hypothetical protein n=1 Tax=Streptobacillus notomytis TaxID=1712031 RepID=UPI000935C27D|nr:hypothetical protein [Streptobacillus notomytis]
MNKMAFGLLAITSIASFSGTTGNFETGGSVKFGKGIDTSIDEKAKLGIYLDSNKNLYGFTHLEASREKILENNSKIKRFIGFSYQKKLGDKTDIGFYGAYKNLVMLDYKKDESFKDELTKHLSIKNKYRDDFNFFQKTDALNRIGYESETDKNIILGIYGNTRIKRTDIYLSGSYISNNFKKETNRLYAYLETNTIYNLGFFNTKLIYDVDGEEKDKSKILHKNSKTDDKINIAKNGGAINLDFKFSSSRILQDTFFYNQAKLDLKSGIKATEKGERFLEFEQKNYFKYTGIKNLTTVGKLDYELKHSVYIDKGRTTSKSTKKSSSKDSSNSDELVTENKHTVRVTGNADYNTDKYRVFGEFSTSNSISIGKTKFVNYTYDLKSILEYNVSDNLKLTADGSYRTFVSSFFDNSDATLRLGYKSSGRNGRLIYDSKSDVSYRMFGFSKNDITNSIFSLSENKLTYLNRGFKVEANLNFASEYEMVAKEEKNTSGKKKVSSEVVPATKVAAKAAKPKTSKPKAGSGVTITETNNLLLFVNPGFKMSYKRGRVYFGTDIQFAYSRDEFYDNKSNKYGLINKNEFRYDVKENITLLTGIDLDYRENKISFDHMKHFTDYVDNLGFNQFKFYKYRIKEDESTNGKKSSSGNNGTVKYEYNDAKKFEIEDEPQKDREIKAKVSLGSEIKLVENRLSIKPETSFTYVYSNGNSAAEHKYIGGFGLNISYNW